jgi:hypothetical protein
MDYLNSSSDIEWVIMNSYDPRNENNDMSRNFEIYRTKGDYKEAMKKLGDPDYEKRLNNSNQPEPPPFPTPTSTPKNTPEDIPSNPTNLFLSDDESNTNHTTNPQDLQPTTNILTRYELMEKEDEATFPHQNAEAGTLGTILPQRYSIQSQSTLDPISLIEVAEELRMRELRAAEQARETLDRENLSSSSSDDISQTIKLFETDDQDNTFSAAFSTPTANNTEPSTTTVTNPTTNSNTPTLHSCQSFQSYITNVNEGNKEQTIIDLAWN